MPQGQKEKEKLAATKIASCGFFPVPFWSFQCQIKSFEDSVWTIYSLKIQMYLGKDFTFSYPNELVQALLLGGRFMLNAKWPTRSDLFCFFVKYL